MTALAGYGGIFYSPALTDFVFMFAHDDEATCLEEVRYLLSLLPDNSRALPLAHPTPDPADGRCESLVDLVPADGSRSCDMHQVIEEITDDGEYLEVQERWAPNVIVAPARMDGHTVGIVASQPQSLAGVLDIHAAEKAARFVQMRHAFNIPLVTLLDVPCLLPGVDQEHGGIIRHGAKLLYAYCNATVPRIQLILRKAYGGERDFPPPDPGRRRPRRHAPTHGQGAARYTHEWATTDHPETDLTPSRALALSSPRPWASGGARRSQALDRLAVKLPRGPAC